jgi:hypothetical protein
MCWKNEECNLASCIISTVNYNNSNCGTHFEHNHTPDELPPELVPTSGATKKSLELNLKQTVNKITNYSRTTNTNDNGGSCDPRIALSYLYHFFNEANIAIMQANNHYLKLFIDYLLDNAGVLKLKRSEV